MSEMRAARASRRSFYACVRFSLDARSGAMLTRGTASASSDACARLFRRRAARGVRMSRATARGGSASSACLCVEGAGSADALSRLQVETLLSSSAFFLRNAHRSEGMIYAPSQHEWQAKESE